MRKLIICWLAGTWVFSGALSYANTRDRETETVVPSPTTSTVQALDNLNQCAGTMQHYRLPPTGYVPPKKDHLSTEGERLYQKLECAQCHKIANQGGELGPPLDGIGGHRGQQFLEARLLNPELQMRMYPDAFGGRPNIMPHPGVTAKEAKLVAKYLLTLPEPAGGFEFNSHKIKTLESARHIQFTQRNPGESKLSAEQGRAAFLRHGCACCHSVEESGGRFGPKLDGIGKRRTAQNIADVLQGGIENPAMSAQGSKLSESEIIDIVEFLRNLPAAPETNESKSTVPKS